MATAELTRLAGRLYAAVRAVRDQLDDQFKAALFASDGAASGAWGLALVLASWRRQKAGDSLSELADTGIGALVSQIQNFENAFPASFSKFLDAAEKATDAGRIAAAGSYFASTVRDLGFVVRPGLLSWLNSPGFTKVATALRGKLGGPADAAQTVAVVPPASRVRSFDQADYPPPRRPAESPPVVQDQQPAPVALTMQLPVVRDQQPAPVARTTQISASPAPIQVEAPRTTQRDMQLAALIAAGWSPEQAALILAGPNGKSQTPPGTKQTDAARPVIDGQTILDRANPKKDPSTPSTTSSDVAAITGVVKSGLDVLGEILKQVNSGGSKGSGGGQRDGFSGGDGSMTGFGGGGSTTSFEGGGSMTGYGGGTPSVDYGTDMPSYGGPGTFGDGGTIFDINDSSEVID